MTALHYHRGMQPGPETHGLRGDSIFIRRFEVAVVDGPDRGARAVSSDDELTIGTAPGCQLQVTDGAVSRHHCAIRVTARGLELRDLGSTNGTFIGDQEFVRGYIRSGARLRLGNTTVAVTILADEITQPLASEGAFGDLIGASPTMRRLYPILERTAASDATALIEGETGTGKELVAEAIHLRSARRGKPFVVVDCGVIPHELIASELFGHARGAYTGATADKKGLIESANGGTLFLDEIGELALDLQPQLLRVLDRRQVRRVGENHSVDVDIRVVAATHRDLRAMVRAGQFREDLYYRLAVVRTTVPPLRDRTSDIAALAAHFATAYGHGDFSISPSLLDQLQRHPWPGNVRELRNVVERALSLGSAGLDEIGGEPGAEPAARDPDTDEGLAAIPSGTPAEVLEMPFKEAKATLIESFERDYLTHLLARHRGNISRAATEAGIDRNYIHRLVTKDGLEVDRG